MANVHNNYERGDIALVDVKKERDNVYEHGDIALGRNDDAPKANADYGVLPTSGYGVLPINDGYGPVLT